MPPPQRARPSAHVNRLRQGINLEPQVRQIVDVGELGTVDLERTRALGRGGDDRGVMTGVDLPDVKIGDPVPADLGSTRGRSTSPWTSRSTVRRAC